ncbi:lysophospholipase L1-like esterase [Microbacterium sp. AG1240]|uniref:SGNH/GDSL hydrolase family protein n=1 Tax=Microbacterium sp. AG1240 TaxID=2183992 RepID=UPI000F1298AB|nr:SGNH/GDSL hydrolase family protein [Microbacterium sp. AG1240]RKT33688.1 lysophospholipase L1-like esterase [Microbacterium sp. AG1240]
MAIVGVLVVGTGALSAYALNRSAPTTAAPLPIRTEFSYGSEREPVTTIAFLGDSWAGGAGVPGGGPDNSYAARTAREIGWPYDIFAGGGTGYTFPENTRFMSRVAPLIEAAPDVVVVQGSSNDYRASEEEIRQAADEVFAAIRAGLPEARIYALGVFDSPGAPTDLNDVSRRAVSAAAAASGVTWIDGNADGWLNVETDFADGYHPNEGGHQKVADQLAAYLEAQ